MPRGNPINRIHREAARARTVARKAVGITYPYPVELVEGDQSPTLLGEYGYHTTPSGKTIVRYPGAYKWRTWYHRSTLRVVVGEAHPIGHQIKLTSLFVAVVESRV